MCHSGHPSFQIYVIPNYCHSEYLSLNLSFQIATVYTSSQRVRKLTSIGGHIFKYLKKVFISFLYVCSNGWFLIQIMLMWNILVQTPEVLAIPCCFHKMKFLLVNANHLDHAPGLESLIRLWKGCEIVVKYGHSQYCDKPLSTFPQC